ncbi:hypothetical protein [Clostridium sp. SHJSY1]|nr:hypothetical protein [Clostridium sp. SHJSY1]
MANYFMSFGSREDYKNKKGCLFKRYKKEIFGTDIKGEAAIDDMG